MTTPMPSDPDEAETSSADRSGLRGPEVSFNKERVVQVVVGLVLAGLATLSILLFLGALSADAQQNRLRHAGIPVTAKVTNCLGQLGGSGTNPLGFACTVSYEVDGVEHSEVIGGINTLTPNGTVIDGVVDPNNHGEVFTTEAVASMHSSWTRLLAPSALLLAFVVVLAIVVARVRRRAPSP